MRSNGRKRGEGMTDHELLEMAAKAAAKDTCKRADDEGDTWPSKYSFVAIEVM